MINATRMAAPTLGYRSGLVHRVVVRLPNSKRGQASGYGHFWLLLSWGKACHVPKHIVRVGGDYTMGTGVTLGKVLCLRHITTDTHPRGCWRGAVPVLAAA